MNQFSKKRRIIRMTTPWQKTSSSFWKPNVSADTNRLPFMKQMKCCKHQKNAVTTQFFGRHCRPMWTAAAPLGAVAFSCNEIDPENSLLQSLCSADWFHAVFADSISSPCSAQKPPTNAFLLHSRVCGRFFLCSPKIARRGAKIQLWRLWRYFREQGTVTVPSSR